MSNPIRARRIQREIELVKKDQEALAANGIYFWFNEADIGEMRILINPGKDNQPYAGGFFVFDVTFPSEYPMSPPKVEFNPKQNTVRFHPNYYQNGKVCLSIINTWGEKQWASSMTMIAFANTLISRMDEHAITGEPGHEKDTPAAKQGYNSYVEYGKYVEAIAAILKREQSNQLAPAYKPFIAIIKANFKKQYAEYHRERLQVLKEEYDGKPVGTLRYAGMITANYTAVIKDLEALAR